MFNTVRGKRLYKIFQIFQHSTAHSAPQTAQPVPLLSQLAEASLDMLGTCSAFQRILSGWQKQTGR